MKEAQERLLTEPVRVNDKSVKKAVKAALKKPSESKQEKYLAGLHQRAVSIFNQEHPGSKLIDCCGNQVYQAEDIWDVIQRSTDTIDQYLDHYLPKDQFGQIDPNGLWILYERIADWDFSNCSVNKQQSIAAIQQLLLNKLGDRQEEYLRERGYEIAEDERFVAIFPYVVALNEVKTICSNYLEKIAKQSGKDELRIVLDRLRKAADFANHPSLVATKQLTKEMMKEFSRKILTDFNRPGVQRVLKNNRSLTQKLIDCLDRLLCYIGIRLPKPPDQKIADHLLRLDLSRPRPNPPPCANPQPPQQRAPRNRASKASCELDLKQLNNMLIPAF